MLIDISKYDNTEKQIIKHVICRTVDDLAIQDTDWRVNCPRILLVALTELEKKNFVLKDI